jgi:hypothetical protein
LTNIAATPLSVFSLALNVQDDEDRSRLLEMVEAWLKLATRPVRALKTGDASQG